ncbi:MAG: peptidoglycan-binding domain-containing protein [bacterium]
MPKYIIKIVVLACLLLASPVLAATTDFVADSNITVTGVTFGSTTADIIIIDGSKAESWSFNGGTFTVTNPHVTSTFKIGSSDSTVKSFLIKNAANHNEACNKNYTPGTSYVTLPGDTAVFTLTLGTVNLSNTVTYNADCGAATCESGYSVNGSGSSAVCISSAGGGGGGGGSSSTTTPTYQTYNPTTGETTTTPTTTVPTTTPITTEPTWGATASTSTSATWSDPALVKATIAFEKDMVTQVNNPLRARLAGNILLQVEANGEGWYVNPGDQQKYYLGRPADAYEIMRFLSVGITDTDLARAQANTGFALKHKGKIFLQVQQHGEAYYVDFQGKLHYMKDGAAAYDIMRGFGLGITNKDIRQIPVGETTTASQQVQGVKIETTVAPDILLPSDYVFTSFMKLGDTGGQVKPLQQLLQQLGFFPTDQAITGYYGPLTETAVKALQAANGIEQAGYVGPATREVLNSY